MKKRLTFLAILIAILAIVLSSSVSAAPSVTITAPHDNGYYLQSRPVTFTANVSGNPTSVILTFLCRQGRDSNIYREYTYPINDPNNGKLTRVGSTNNYSTTLTFANWAYNTWYWPRLSNPVPPSGSLGVIRPQIKITATDATGSTSVTQYGAICRDTLAGFRTTDPAFAYSDEYNNNFLGTATGHPNPVNAPIPGDGVDPRWTYNCMAYALYQISGGWMWPWSGLPDEQTQLTPYMQGQGYQKLSSPAYAQVIYYANGHFSRVFTWDVNHTPTTIYSKWGGSELIKSSSYNPFTSGSYGSALYYYKHN